MTDEPNLLDTNEDDDLSPAQLARRVRSHNPFAPPPERDDDENDPAALAAKVRRY